MCHMRHKVLQIKKYSKRRAGSFINSADYLSVYHWNTCHIFHSEFEADPSPCLIFPMELKPRGKRIACV